MNQPIGWTKETQVIPKETTGVYKSPQGNVRPQKNTIVALMDGKLDQGWLKRIVTKTANNKYKGIRIPPDLVNNLFLGKSVPWEYAKIACTALNITNPEDIFRAVTEADLAQEESKKNAKFQQKKKVPTQ